MPTVLGIDSSTQSTKVELRDSDDGTLVGAARAPHPATHPPRSEQDPVAWWAALCGAVGQLDHPAPDAVAVAGQQHGMVTLDAARTVIRPAKLWNDTESSPQAARLTRQLGVDTWTQATGLVPVASFTVTKVAWLAEREPDHASRVAHLLLPHDWLTLRLTDQLVTDRGDASGTGYFDPVANTWRGDLLMAADPSRTADEWEACLPRVLGPVDTAGTLTGPAADELGLSVGAVVAAGTGDNMAAALGLALAPGDVVVSLGTSGTVFAAAATPTRDRLGLVAGFADATGGYLPLVCTLNATQVTDTFAALLDTTREQLAALALEEEAGAGGVVLVPYLNGERTPNRPDATGTLTGLRTDASRSQLARAAFEGVACGLLDGLDALGAAGVDHAAGRLLVIGGGARSSAYPQILADLAGRPVTVVSGDEHVATGAGVQAAAALTGHPPLEVARAWGLGSGRDVEPATDRGVEVRQAYAAARG